MEKPASTRQDYADNLSPDLRNRAGSHSGIGITAISE
jgi:hypothetical protein